MPGPGIVSGYRESSHPSPVAFTPKLFLGHMDKLEFFSLISSVLPCI